MNTCSAFLVAAPKSNSGKTLITLGLIHALKKRGLKVQAYKCGPDYIDPLHHSKIAGRPSYNLDLWMSGSEHIKELFTYHSVNSDVLVTEGVMGLFDGAKKDESSSASIAKLLQLPVVLVVDTSSVAYSVAPLLYGFKNFDKNCKLAGVIFNKVGSDSHFQFLKEAAFDTGVEVLGCVFRDKRLAIESRHLGLHLPGENSNMQVVETAAMLIEKQVDIDLLLKLSERTINKPENRHPDSERKKLTVALASDEAFNFSYRANHDVLAEIGRVKYFSPVHDTQLPNADLVWLPGGYPELFAKKLAHNTKMKQEIKQHIEAGKAVIAECGGMMYLGKNIITKEGNVFPMIGIFDFETSFQNMKLHLGYREIISTDFNVKGHEFHYSELTGNEKQKATCKIVTARQKEIDMPVFRYKNCWASYMHLYLGEKDKMSHFLKQLEL